MTIRFLCPSGHHLSVDESHAGKSVRCAVCQETAIVPGPVQSDGPPALPAKPLPPPLVVARVPATPQEWKAVLGPPASAPPILKARAVADPPAVVPAPALAPTPAIAPTPIAKPSPEPPALRPASQRTPEVTVARLPASSAKSPATQPPVVPPTPAPVRVESPWSDPVLPAPVSLPAPVPAIEPAAPRRSSKREAASAATPAGADTFAFVPTTNLAPRPQRRAAAGRKRIPADVYLPDARHIAQVRWLAAMLGAALLFSLLPLLTNAHLDPADAPGWARAVLLLTLLQAVYVAWMLAAPDWASVWVVMLVFAIAAAFYGAATAVTVATPADKPLPLGLDAVRAGARSWCGAVLAVMTLATYLCGRISAHWRRDCQREAAARAS